MAKNKQRKLYLESGKEVQLGDEICVERTKVTDLGYVKRVTILTVTEDNVDKLIEKGILNVSKAYKCVSNLEECKALLAKKAKMSIEDVNKYIDTTLKIYPAAALSIMLRVIALDFEHKYKGSITDCLHVFIVSLIDGKVHEGYLDENTNWGNFSAFRTEEDCKEALRITQPILDVMYGKQENP